MKIVYVVVFLSISLFSSQAFACSGDWDRFGCHTCSATGVYECRPGSAGPTGTSHPITSEGYFGISAAATSLGTLMFIAQNALYSTGDNSNFLAWWSIFFAVGSEITALIPEISSLSYDPMPLGFLTTCNIILVVGSFIDIALTHSRARIIREDGIFYRHREQGLENPRPYRRPIRISFGIGLQFIYLSGTF